MTYRKCERGQWRAIASFGRIYGWTPANGRCEGVEFGLYALAQGLNRRSRRSSWALGSLDLFDHPFEYKDAEGRIAAIVSHPYDGREKLDMACDFAGSHGLLVELSDLPSWQDPKRASLFIWTRNPGISSAALTAALAGIKRLERNAW